jgi:hypothetical protein
LSFASGPAFIPILSRFQGLTSPVFGSQEQAYKVLPKDASHFIGLNQSHVQRTAFAGYAPPDILPTLPGGPGGQFRPDQFSEIAHFKASAPASFGYKLHKILHEKR